MERLLETFKAIIQMGFVSKKNKTRFNYILTFFVYGMGGIPLFYFSKEFKVLIFVFLIAVFIFKRKKIDIFLIRTIFFVSLIFIFQTIIFGAGTFINYALIFLLFINPFLFYKIIGRDFPIYFVNVAYFFAFISFGFYILSNIFPAFYHFTSALPFILNTDPTEIPDIPGVDPTYFKQSFILYTFEHAKVYGNILRCPGQFWEPGVYGSYLILALIFNYSLNGNFFDKKAIVFIIAIIITFSTAALIALFVYILAYSVNIRSPIIATLATIIIIPLSIYFYSSQEFLSGKVDKTFNERNLNMAADQNRYISALYGLNTIYHNPVFGRGLIKDTAPSLSEEQSVAYGFIGMIARFGIPMFLFMVIGFYKGFKILNRKKNKSFNYFAALMILIILFGQAIYLAPIFLMIFYNSNSKYEFT